MDKTPVSSSGRKRRNSSLHTPLSSGLKLRRTSRTSRTSPRVAVTPGRDRIPGSHKSGATEPRSLKLLSPNAYSTPNNRRSLLRPITPSEKKVDTSGSKGTTRWNSPSSEHWDDMFGSDSKTSGGKFGFQPGVHDTMAFEAPFSDDPIQSSDAPGPEQPTISPNTLPNLQDSTEVIMGFGPPAVNPASGTACDVPTEVILAGDLLGIPLSPVQEEEPPSKVEGDHNFMEEDCNVGDEHCGTKSINDSKVDNLSQEITPQKRGSQDRRSLSISSAAREPTWMDDMCSYLSTNKNPELEAQRNSLFEALKEDCTSSENWWRFFSHEEGLPEPPPAIDQQGNISLFHLYQWAVDMVPETAEHYVQIWIGYCGRLWAEDPDEAMLMLTSGMRSNFGSKSMDLLKEAIRCQCAMGEKDKALNTIRIRLQWARLRSEPLGQLEKLAEDTRSGSLPPYQPLGIVYGMV